MYHQVKGLPTHEGPKVRHNKRDKGDNKPGISRKDLKKSEQERKDPKLRRKRQKRRLAEENEAKKVAGAASDEPKKKKAKKVKKAEAKKDLREDKQFAEMVSKYKQKLEGGGMVNERAKSKWFK